MVNLPIQLVYSQRWKVWWLAEFKYLGKGNKCVYLNHTSTTLLTISGKMCGRGVEQEGGLMQTCNVV